MKNDKSVVENHMRLFLKQNSKSSCRLFFLHDEHIIENLLENILTSNLSVFYYILITVSFLVFTKESVKFSSLLKKQVHLISEFSKERIMRQ